MQRYNVFEGWLEIKSTARILSSLWSILLLSLPWAWLVNLLVSGWWACSSWLCSLDYRFMSCSTRSEDAKTLRANSHTRSLKWVSWLQMIVVLKQKIKKAVLYTKLFLGIDQTYFLINHEDSLYFVASSLMKQTHGWTKRLFPNDLSFTKHRLLGVREAFKIFLTQNSGDKAFNEIDSELW